MMEFQDFAARLFVEASRQIWDDIFITVVGKARGQRPRATIIQDADDFEVFGNHGDDKFIGNGAVEPGQDRAEIGAENFAE